MAVLGIAENDAESSLPSGDDEAHLRGTQKSILERKAPATFPVVIEIRERSFWVTHWTEDSVDFMLAGKDPAVQVLGICLMCAAKMWCGLCYEGHLPSTGQEKRCRKQAGAGGREAICACFQPVARGGDRQLCRKCSLEREHLSEGLCAVFKF